MTTNRKISQLIDPKLVVEGAGVKLKRSFPGQGNDNFDPFLLLDDFSSVNPEDFVAGFPWHPHRGIETVTYILDGSVRHGDSLGNTGEIGPGDAQWMTSGSGIMHEEMPQRGEGRLKGFQLWVNLPAARKMSPPRYQDVTADSIPVIQPTAGVNIRVIAGRIGDAAGPVSEIAVDPMYLEVELLPGTGTDHPVQNGHTVLMYVFEGAVILAGAGDPSPAEIAAPKLIVLGDGDRVSVRAAAPGARYILFSGKPLNEPIARYGPFVMNTQEEIEQALSDLRNGTFVK